MKSIKIALVVSAVFGTTLAGAVHASSMSVDSTIIAREASEAPRGSDNDKHRGRSKAIEQFDRLARESSELPSGKDNEKRGDKQRGRHA
jgi:hypothetical protein